ncbi:hypothetical protein E2C01_059451 [Portunus trituberculatus]|uniref:Uncharacterized protein n=1 Tax=Portunus trituberculatus TaxID=210409 RepID=A0A5B7H8E3_PORTR|nr:hypothetical protein [Portunus trituberculatus]
MMVKMTATTAIAAAITNDDNQMDTAISPSSISLTTATKRVLASPTRASYKTPRTNQNNHHQTEKAQAFFLLRVTTGPRCLLTPHASPKPSMPPT